MDNELLLIDRIGVIRDTIKKFGEDKFYISYSGGKDSTVLSYLIDLALPYNKIPRVYINTGIEYTHIVDFVKSKMEKDSRFVMVMPTTPIKQMLETKGYPFKSKLHSQTVGRFQCSGMCKSVNAYVNVNKSGQFKCPEKLKYQFTPEFKLKLSDKCCLEMKKKPAKKWAKEHNKTICIIGILGDEHGVRGKNLYTINTCFDKKQTKFYPLKKVNKEWETWFINKYNIELCKLYYQPYNFERTGCKGCPFSLHLQKDLETMEKLLPNERKQCEFIWEPVYKEYRRLKYRLKEENNEKEN